MRVKRPMQKALLDDALRLCDRTLQSLVTRFLLLEPPLHGLQLSALRTQLLLQGLNARTHACTHRGSLCMDSSA